MLFQPLFTAFARCYLKSGYFDSDAYEKNLSGPSCRSNNIFKLSFSQWDSAGKKAQPHSTISASTKQGAQHAWHTKSKDQKATRAILLVILAFGAENYER